MNGNWWDGECENFRRGMGEDGFKGLLIGDKVWDKCPDLRPSCKQVEYLVGEKVSLQYIYMEEKKSFKRQTRTIWLCVGFFGESGRIYKGESPKWNSPCTSDMSSYRVSRLFIEQFGDVSV